MSHPMEPESLESPEPPGSSNTPDDSDALLEHYRAALRARLEGRRVILAMGVVAGMTGAVKTLAELGAGPFCLLAYGIGAGELPDPTLAAWHIVCDLPPGLSMSEELAHFGRAVDALPKAVVDAIDAFDPDGTALVLPGFPVDFAAAAGRPNAARRDPAWIALEDKTVVDALWDRLGVPRLPSAVVPVADAPAAHRALGAGRGTVWAADARDGWHGGATGTRWVRDDGFVDEALAFFGARADRVRVMPFAEGIPCSIHGMVLGDAVVAFRPCEMVVLRQAGDSRFRYAGAATQWDPPAADRAEMRAIARRVGHGLRTLYGFRGAFTVDGVLTAEGFRPTELNPRFGAGLVIMTRHTGLPLMWLDLFARGGHAIDWKASALERWVVAAADAERVGGGWTVAGGQRRDSVTHDVVWTGAAYRLATPGEPADGTLMVGPGPSGDGTFTRFSPAPGHLPVGPSVAPRVVEAFRLAEALGAVMGPLEPARAVRGG